MRALALVAVFLAGACWHKRPPRPDDERRALEIAGQVYGIEFLPAEPPQLTVHYPEPTCADQFDKHGTAGRPGARTVKKNCSCGFLAPWTPHINVVRVAGQRLADTCFCSAAKQAAEAAVYGVPDTYCATDECKSGERLRIINRCTERLREAGL